MDFNRMGWSQFGRSRSPTRLGRHRRLPRNRQFNFLCPRENTFLMDSFDRVSLVAIRGDLPLFLLVVG